MSSILPQLGAAKILPVVVVDTVEQGMSVAQSLREGGLLVAEVTFRTPAAAAVIAAIADRIPDMLLGAGTVTTPAQVDAAVDAGARFLVSPGLSETVIHRAQDREVPIIPGVATPTEMMRALDLGLELLKLFPAGMVGGPKAVRALSAPFPAVRFIPTGGVGLQNIHEYLALPQVHAVGGSWMVEPALVKTGQWTEITARTAAAVAIAKGNS